MHLETPLDNPVIVFALFLSIILFAPAIAKRLKVPGIIGLIFAGIIIGPEGLNLISKELNIRIFSSVGIMYIMFLAGVDINLQSFKSNLSKSIFFGFLTFIIPSLAGFLIAFFILKLNFLAAFLLSLMLAAHTLLSYPIVTKYRLNKTLSSTITIAGTIITDTAVLLLLVLVTTHSNGEMNFAFVIKMLIQLAIFLFLVFWVFPKLSRWFLKYYTSNNNNKFLFVLFIVFLSGTIAELIGIEPIIGAFFAGLALNRLIPSSSTLLDKLEFVGNNIFIPFFLISLGMLVNLKILFSGIETLIYAAILIVIALISKYLAALITQKKFKLSKDEKNLIFGLSVSRAAATIAVATIGYDEGIINESILNASVLIVLFTSLISSFFTEKACKSLILNQNNLVEKEEISTQKILVAISNPETAFNLIDFAISLKDKNSEFPIYGLNIVLDNDNRHEEILKNKNLITKLIHHAELKETKLQSYMKIDLNIADGIAKSIIELNADKTIIGWNGHTSTTDYIFGSLMEKIVVKTDNTIIVIKNITSKIGQCRKINVILPENILHEKGVNILYDIFIRFSQNMYAKLNFFVGKKFLYNFTNEINVFKKLDNTTFSFINFPDEFLEIKEKISKDDFLFVVSSRPNHVSFCTELNSIPKILAKNFEEYNFAIIFPY